MHNTLTATKLLMVELRRTANDLERGTNGQDSQKMQAIKSLQEQLVIAQEALSNASRDFQSWQDA